MNHHVKKIEIKDAEEVKQNKCEICNGQAVTGQIDKEKNIRWSCLDHIDELYKKIK